MSKYNELLNRYGYSDAVELYNDAQNAYELTDKPIMTDGDFDYLKENLIADNLIEFQAGVDELKGDKKPHVYPMLSIHSVHRSNLDTQEKLGEYLKNKYGENWKTDSYSVSWKLDGIALQAKYEDGLLVHVLTRGERTHGVDVTENVKHAFPEKVDPYVKAIIGEAVLSKQVFEEKFSRYKNERNATGGLINSKGKYGDEVKEIDFVAFKIINIDDNVLCASENDHVFEELPKNFWIVPQHTVKAKDLHNFIMDMEKGRPDFMYRTDGVVIRNNSQDQNESHRGLYKAFTAFKFDALQATTKIKHIDFRVCNNGALFPRAILDPVDLDGSTVRHVSLFNYANMKENGLFPEAEIIIVKSGDIIPHVDQVLKPVYETPEFIEKYEIEKYTYDGVNLFTDEDLTELKFIKGVEKLGLKNVGDALAKILFDGGFTHTTDLFQLGESSEFDRKMNTKPINNMIDQIYEMFKNVSITKLIQSLRFHGVGETSSKKIAIMFTDLAKTLSGAELCTAVQIKYLTEANPNVYEVAFFESDEYLRFSSIVVKYEDRINFDGVVEVISETAIKVVMTGSPKEHGFAKKSDFIDQMKAKGIEVHEVKTLKDADYLITDDMESTSSKMKQAEKLGIKIKLYSEF